MPLQKNKGGGGDFSHAEKGEHKKFGVVITQELEVLAVLKGGTQNPPFKRGELRKKLYTIFALLN